MKTTENDNGPKLNIDGVSESDLKQNSFSIPENYFENLTPRIMESVRDSGDVSKRPTFSWNRVLAPAFGVATIAVAALFFLNPREKAPPNFDAILATLSVEELAEFTDLQPTEMIQYELVDYDQLGLSQELTQEELIEYLDTENEIELNVLMNEIDI